MNRKAKKRNQGTDVVPHAFSGRESARETQAARLLPSRSNWETGDSAGASTPEFGVKLVAASVNDLESTATYIAQVRLSLRQANNLSGNAAMSRQAPLRQGLSPFIKKRCT
ncbi:MAG: hypothetical protein JNM43_01470 [Planctomycetaceae bacterium]|nr:hypothetical protein [Planctomycetaceae bacterium]